MSALGKSGGRCDGMSSKRGPQVTADHHAEGSLPIASQANHQENFCAVFTASREPRAGSSGSLVGIAAQTDKAYKPTDPHSKERERRENENQVWTPNTNRSIVRYMGL